MSVGNATVVKFYKDGDDMSVSTNAKSDRVTSRAIYRPFQALPRIKGYTVAR